MKRIILCIGFAALALGACGKKKGAEEPGRDTTSRYGEPVGGWGEGGEHADRELQPGQQVGTAEQPNVVWLEAYSYELDVPEQAGAAPAVAPERKREGVRWSGEQMTEEERKRYEERQAEERKRREEWQKSEAGQRARESTRRLAESGRARTEAATSPSGRTASTHTIDISREARNIMIERNMQDAQVKARICVSEQGAPIYVDIAESSGVEAIDTKVREEMQRWRYQPQTIGGEPVPFCELVTFRYQLRYGQGQGQPGQEQPAAPGQQPAGQEQPAGQNQGQGQEPAAGQGQELQGGQQGQGLDTQQPGQDQQQDKAKKGKKGKKKGQHRSKKQ